MGNRLQGELSLPGDKSISHRALMFLGLAGGQTATVENLSSGQDVMSTLGCMRALGCRIEPVGENRWQVTAPQRLSAPAEPLDCGNSGTTIRLLTGILAGANLSATLTGDHSLTKRPMRRILKPLGEMGARLQTTGEEQTAPITVQSADQPLHGIAYAMPEASAQVKSAILLAGLFLPEDERLEIIESVPSRDHTERMLSAMGVRVQTAGNNILLEGRLGDLKAQDIRVPGDVSSAAFWIVGAGILPGSEIVIRNVLLNPLRTGLLELARAVGVGIETQNAGETVGEPSGDLVISAPAAGLKGNITVTPEMVPSLIDEIPILTVLGLFNNGITSVRGAEELRYKESDRLAALIHLLNALQVDVDVYDDGFSFAGNPDWQPPVLETPFLTHQDHRLVMALEILNLRCQTPLEVPEREWAAVSYPTFFQTLNQLRRASVPVA